MIRFDRMQRGLFLALSGIIFGGVATDVVWAKNEVPRGELTKNLLVLRITSGPLDVRRPLAGYTAASAKRLDLTVTGATVGKLAIARLNGFDYRHEVTGGDTAMTVRDSLLAQIREGEAGAVDVARLGADALRLTAAMAGGLRSLSLVGELAAGNQVAGDDIIIKEGTTSTIVTLQAFTRGKEERDGAVALIDLAHDALRSEDAIELLALHGVAVWDEGSPVDLSAIAGANWESRSARDLTVAAQSVSVRPVATIGHVGMTVSVGLVPGGPAIETFTASASAGA